MYEIMQITWLAVLCLQISVFGGYYLYMRKVCASNEEESSIIKNENVDPAPTVAFFIPTYNEEANIAGKLSNTFKLTYPQEKMEVVVIDDASTDKTVQRVEEFINVHPEHRIQIVRKTGRRGKVDSIGIIVDMKRETDLVCISDADITLDREVLLEVVKRFKDPKIGTVCGREVVCARGDNAATNMEKAYRNLYITLRVGESILHSTPIFEAGILVIRNDLLKMTKSSSGADDTILAFEVVKAGYKAVEEPKALFYEQVPETLIERGKQNARRGKHLAQVFIENSSMLFRKKYGLFGMLILPIETYMHVVSPFLCLLLIALLPFVFFNIITVLILGCLTSLLILPKSRITLLSFLSSQLALVIGLFSLAAGKKEELY